MRMTIALVLVLLAGCQTSATDGGGATCTGPLGKPIPESQLGGMTACCQADGGHAHCLANVPGEIQGFLAACDSGGSCVPDSFLTTGGAVPPQQCTAFGGPGVCLSRCVPQVSMNAALLKPDVCSGSDELCVPCTSPVDNMPTHACDLLTTARCEGDTGSGSGSGSGSAAACDDPKTCEYEASCPPVIDPSTLPSCATDAHCIDSALVDPGEAAQLAPCSTAGKLCVPDTFIKTGGKFVPPTCTSIAGAEGRCLSMAIPDVQKQATMLPQATCATTERCAPCYDPITGASTGACNLSCDTGPTRPAVKFAQCCQAQAHCVPTSAVPTDEQDNLSQQECSAQNLCVPDQLLLDQPIPTCSASSFLLGNYTGVCLSNCLDFGIEGAALERGNCGANFTCAPCSIAGQATGAPGCP